MITARITLAILMHPDRLNPGQCGCGAAFTEALIPSRQCQVAAHMDIKYGLVGRPLPQVQIRTSPLSPLL